MNKCFLIVSVSVLLAAATAANYCSIARPPSNVGVYNPDTLIMRHTDTGAWMIHYYIDQGTLSYAVILGPSARITGGWVGSGTTSHGTPFVKLWQPGDKLTSLMGSGRVFQVIDPDCGKNNGVRGQVTELSERISGTTFQAFIESKPSDYSLASLTSYSKAHH